MPSDSQPVEFRHRIAPEDAARADFYALAARLFADAPDQSILAAIAAAPPLSGGEPGDEAGSADPELELAWDRLRLASSVMEPDAAQQEYTDLFVGVGASLVNLHGSHWRTGFMMDRPLVELRAELQSLGLARLPAATMVEDHLSALCETMRILIAGTTERRPEPPSRQRDFFGRHLAPWVFACCDAIATNAIANYYRSVAQWTKQFLALERDSLAMED